MGKHKIGRHVSLAIKNHLVLSAAASSVFRSRSAYHPIFLSQQFNTSTRYRHSLFNFSGSNSSTQSVDSAATLQSLETDWSGSSPILGPDINLPENLVSTNGLESCSLGALLSQEQLELLNTMDKLRAYGVSEFVSLPQIVVCGDQSAGKSSVLEAITEIRFPRKENLCTTFATEIVLRRSPTSKVSVGIIPGGAERSQTDRDQLAAFRYTIESFNELPELIEKARAAMRLGSNSTFSRDVLSIEISGPTQPHLTVVDLPGLIHVDAKSQDSSDVQLVSDLVGSYMQNPRSIILAVVTAMNDFQNQIVLQRAKKVDPEGRRTLGVITKPDSIPVGSEKEDAFISLAKNEDIFFALGWHVLRNRKYEERNDSTEDRNFREGLFFQTGAWKDIPRDSVGIETLRSRLSQLLYAHIKGELPKVYKDIRDGLQNCGEMLAKLGAKRESKFEQRQFLTKISMEFVNLCKAAVDGHYEDKFFGEGVVVDATSIHKRLRAVIQKKNTSFAKQIRGRGHTYEIDKQFDNVASIKDKDRYPHGEGGPKRITHAEATNWVKPLLENSRGRELSGTFDPILICPLFREQSMKWEELAINHLDQSFAACQKFFRELVPYVSRGNQKVAQGLSEHWINSVMNRRQSEAKKELDKLFEDRRSHAITHNHYYTDVIQKFEEESSKMQNLRLAKDFSSGLGKVTASEAISRFLDLLAEHHTQVNMQDYACEQLLRSMLAYYKVASKTFVDNIVIQVVERHLMRGLWDVLSPIAVLSMPDQLVERITAESAKGRNLRKRLEVQKHRSMIGLEICRKVLPDVDAS